MKNLSNFPPVYYINLDFRTDRKKSIEKTFQDYNISNHTRISASNYLGSEQEKWEHLVLDKKVKCGASDVGCTFRLVKKNALDKMSPYFRIKSNFFGPEMMLLTKHILIFMRLAFLGNNQFVVEQPQISHCLDCKQLMA